MILYNSWLCCTRSQKCCSLCFESLGVCGWLVCFHQISLLSYPFPSSSFSTFPFLLPFPTCLGTSPISLALLDLFLYSLLFLLDSILLLFVSFTLPITSHRSSFFLLPPPTCCALHFILPLFFSIARSTLYFSLPWKLCPCPYLFLVQSLFSSYFSCLFHHGAHVHVCLMCWSLLLSSVRPLPTSLPIHPPWPRVDSPLACLPCPPLLHFPLSFPSPSLPLYSLISPRLVSSASHFIHACLLLYSSSTSASPIHFSFPFTILIDLTSLLDAFFDSHPSCSVPSWSTYVNLTSFPSRVAANSWSP